MGNKRRANLCLSRTEQRTTSGRRNDKKFRVTLVRLLPLLPQKQQEKQQQQQQQQKLLNQLQLLLPKVQSIAENGNAAMHRRNWQWSSLFLRTLPI